MIKKIFCIIISIMVILSMFSSVSAKERVENTKVLFRDIKISVDNNILQPDTEPFIYQGRTYIPARALAEAMGGTVTWDENSSTVTVVNYKESNLKNLAYAAYVIKSESASLSMNIINSISDLNRATLYVLLDGKFNENIENFKSSYTRGIAHLKELKSRIISDSYYKETCNFVGMEYNKLENALAYYDSAFFHLRSGFDMIELGVVNFNNHEQFITNCVREAETNLLRGLEIFTEYANEFMQYMLNL